MYKILRDKGYFHLAHNASLLSGQNPRIGAVIVKKKPIAVGFNSLRIHPQFTRYGKYDYDAYTIHAETQAIVTIKRIIDLSGATMYVYREYISGSPAMARPCESCMDALRYFKFKDVFYTIDVYPYWKREKIR